MDKNPTWHVEESPWKAQQIMRSLDKNHLTPKTICEVGCGAGEVLKQLEGYMDQECLFWGYEISPQAFELSRSRANERLRFQLSDIRKEKDVTFDLILVLDVIEHLEDYFSFLRDIKLKSRYKIFHIPLDLSVQTILRRRALLKVRSGYGHLHYFTKEIAIQMLQDSNYKVLDAFYTPRATELPSHEFVRNLLRWPRRLLAALNQDLAARTLGGWSLLVLAE
jgi:SAM-dependent methyltransferase